VRRDRKKKKTDYDIVYMICILFIRKRLMAELNPSRVSGERKTSQQPPSKSMLVGGAHVPKETKGESTKK